MELTNAVVQTVQAGQDVLFANEAVNGSWSILHRNGSGLVTVRGLTNQCRALYQVEFSGNIALPATGTAGEISLAIAVDGEALPASKGIATPAAVSEFHNVGMIAQVAAPRGCCVSVSIQNTSGVDIDVQNANIIVTRIA